MDVIPNRVCLRSTYVYKYSRRLYNSRLGCPNNPWKIGGDKQGITFEKNLIQFTMVCLLCDKVSRSKEEIYILAVVIEQV